MKGKQLKKLEVIMKTKLSTNAQWATKGCIRIFEKQTASEQTCEATHELNGVGFTGADAEILSSFAKQINKGWNLSPKQMAILFKKMPKYWKQLITLIPESKQFEMIGEPLVEA